MMIVKNRLPHDLAGLPLLFLFFFLMIRRPPRSTLFPTRRSSDLCGKRLLRGTRGQTHSSPTKGNSTPCSVLLLPSSRPVRSEEHTSELQSPCNLVCRLLLENKKKETYETAVLYRTSLLSS